MEQIVSLAKKYYADFEKKNWRDIWLWVSMLILVVFASLSLYLFYALLVQFKKSAWEIIVLLLLAELCGLVAFEKSERARKKNILRRYNNTYANMFTPSLFKDIDDCKRHFLSVTLNKSKKDYLAFSHDLIKAIELHNSLQTSLSKTLSQWHLYLYNPDSKQRINALLIMLLSTLILLSSREGLTITSVFEFFDGTTLALIGLLMSYIALFFGLYILGQSLLRYSWRVVFPEPNWEIKFLMRDLLRFHDFTDK